MREIVLQLVQYYSPKALKHPTDECVNKSVSFVNFKERLVFLSTISLSMLTGGK